MLEGAYINFTQQATSILSIENLFDRPIKANLSKKIVPSVSPTIFYHTNP